MKIALGIFVILLLTTVMYLQATVQMTSPVFSAPEIVVMGLVGSLGILAGLMAAYMIIFPKGQK